MTEQEMIAMAADAMRNAYAPYSRYWVGAALETRDGRVYTGCNIENASYGAANCAERTAFFKAVSEGCRSFRRIAIVGGYEGDWKDYAPPCGICRQVMSEFCSREFEIILGRSDGQYRVCTLAELLPLQFEL